MGVRGIFKKDIELDVLKEAIKKIKVGEMWISRKIMSRVIENDDILNYLPTNKTESEINLTEREIEIVNLILKGFKNKEIAKKLYITEKTVKTHVNKIFKKLKVKSRAQLIIKILKENE